MKRFFSIVCLTFTFIGFSQAQNLDKLIKAFKADSSTQYQKITKDMLSMMTAKGDSVATKKTPDFLQQIENMEVFTLENYQGKKAEAIINEIDNFKDGNGFEILLNVNEEGELVKIAVRKNRDMISEMAIIVREEKELMLIRLIGNLSMNDLFQIINEQKKQFSKNN